MNEIKMPLFLVSFTYRRVGILLVEQHSKLPSRADHNSVFASEKYGLIASGIYEFLNFEEKVDFALVVASILLNWNYITAKVLK